MMQPDRNRYPASKPRRRPPWWMLVMAACYIVLLALIPYIVICGPADFLGINADFENGRMVLRSVAADSLLAEAGLRAGDQVVTIDDRPIRGPQPWGVVNSNLEVNRTQRWEILRDKGRIQVEITPGRANWRNRLSAGYISYSALAFCSFAVGLFIAFRRPNDLAARIGSWFIGTASIAFGLPNGWAVFWRESPMVMQTLFWVPTISRFLIEAIFLSLLMVFPHRLSRSRWPWVLIWAPVLMTLPWRISQFSAVIYSPAEAFGVPDWVFQVIFLRRTIYLSAGIIILLVSYRMLLVQEEKRRVRVLLAGTAISLAAAIAVVWRNQIVGFGLQSNLLWIALVHPLTLAAPLAFSYAIVRHRVFDIRVIIRQGLQYAFARGAVLGLVPSMGGILALDLALNSQQPLAEILQTRGWLYFGISAAAVVLYWKRQQWLETIDRRFFREQYDAQQLLQEVVHEVRTAGDVQQAARRVASRVEAALHPEFVSLLVREPSEVAFRSLASLPRDLPPLSLAANSKLVGLASVLGKPVELLLGDSDWLDQRLPWEEIELVRRARIDLLIPITTAPGVTQSLLVLGIRRSEEPYTAKDQELLETIAASLALLLEQRTAVASSAPIELQTQQGTTDSVHQSSYQSPTGMMFSHYKVVRQVGKGGMGEVYLAEDTHLGRNVALKFLPPHLHEDELARKRFLREAKSAASLDHPFICKIYEIGQTDLGSAYIAMEYVEGKTLEKMLTEGLISLEQSLHIASQVTNALEIAHMKGIVHRDLKPANIMLSEQGHAKVMDFGLAKRIVADDVSDQELTANLTREGVAIGTPAYMSPEQIMAQPVDQRSDIFSFGIVFYEMLTGTHPFRRFRALETISAILYEEPPPISDYLSQHSSLLQETVARMLQKDPGQRYSTADELAEDLKRVSVGI